MRVLAPAKLNLYLRVGPRSGDGFHPLLTWMVTVGLFDTLILERGSGEIEFTCSDATLPRGRANLVVRAIEALRAHGEAQLTPDPSDAKGRAGSLAHEELQELRPSSAGLRVRLSKSIPHGAGLGGGSSDAASAMLAANELLRWNLTRQRLSQIAATIGSDVPFFLFGPSSVCTGRGEIVQPIARPSPRWAVLVLPEIALSTAEVYQRFDELEAGKTGGVGAGQPNWQELAGLSAAALLPRLVNDLEPAAFDLQPSLRQLHEAVEQALERPVRMSGSGSSLFTLFDEASEAGAAAGRIVRDHETRAIAVEVAPGDAPA